MNKEIPEYQRVREEMFLILNKRREHHKETTSETPQIYYPFTEFIPDMIKEILAIKGLLIEADDQSLLYCPYDSLIFPTTIKEAGEFLTGKGLTDKEKSAISGTIARLGWENCTEQHKETGFKKVI